MAAFTVNGLILSDIEGRQYNIQELISARNKLNDLGYSFDFGGPKWVKHYYTDSESELLNKLSELNETLYAMREMLTKDVHEYKN